MVKEEVQLLPSGLVTCLINSKEVRILKISPKTLCIRVSSKIKDFSKIIIAFYIFNEYRYEEVKLKNYNLISKDRNKFYFTYSFVIEDEDYLVNVRNITKDYSKYIMLKNFGYENEFSKEMVGYPEELDYDFYDIYSEQKKEWFKNLNYEEYNKEKIDTVELAIALDNYDLYNRYLTLPILELKEEYLKENYIEDHSLFKKKVKRIYIGNEVCHNLFSNESLLLKLMDKALEEKLEVTLSFTYMRDCYIEKYTKLFENIYSWCKTNGKGIEIVINDWGMLKILKEKTELFTLSLGILLNKRKKDPRYNYKNGYKENKELMAENNLNSTMVSTFLEENNIKRYEYEACGYTMKIAKGKHSLHLPFYQTNTSQYCTLYAMCTNTDRGVQSFVKGCPKYCKDYIFSYPKHLKMVGRYNSLFALDDSLLKDSRKLEEYIDKGIDRIVLNFI